MGSVANTIMRIKWRSVFALLIVIGAIYFLVNSLPSSYQVKNNIALKTTADPEVIMPGGTSTITVEVKNLDKEKSITVSVKAKTTDNSMFFSTTYSGDYLKGGILIGPQESRKLNFDVKSKAGSLEGRYGITVEAVEDGSVEGAAETVFINVEDV
ncbi:MAG: hypothetical protein ABIH11_02795 [Candidatus Altiarchaeota archaeon]